MMTLTVHLFARARELAGADAVALELPPGATVAELRRTLAGRFPALAGLLDRSAVAVNHDFADDVRVLLAGDEVAVIPPVSGG
jgi:molybdopterin converting factor subunit 1